MVRGNCDQQISRWYYNPADQYCHPFQYTGCSKFIDFQLFCNRFSFSIYLDGNANSFESEQDCGKICQAKEKGLFFVKRISLIFIIQKNNLDICTLEKDSGTCDQYKIMWYYDSLHGECKNFYYGSCGGNANRFGTEQECQLRCLIKAG